MRILRQFNSFHQLKIVVLTLSSPKGKDPLLVSSGTIRYPESSGSGLITRHKLGFSPWDMSFLSPARMLCCCRPSSR